MNEQVEAWKLKSFTYYTITCSQCLWEPTELAQSAEQAVKQWQEWGWKLTEHGPICPYCQAEHPSTIQDEKEMPAVEDFAQASQQLLSFSEEATK